MPVTWTLLDNFTAPLCANEACKQMGNYIFDIGRSTSYSGRDRAALGVGND